MLTMLAAKIGLSPRVLIGGLIALAVAALLTLTYCLGKSAGKGEANEARLEGNVEAVKADRAADTKAAETRRTDDARLTAEQSELKEVTTNAPDPAAARRAHYRCIRLQQAAREAGREPPSCV